MKQDDVLKEMKCPNCGAPLNPQLGEAMVVCQYCGTSITLGTAGWNQVHRHYILDIRVAMKDQALKIVRSYLNRSILHRHLFEKSTLKQIQLSYVPYWIVDAGFTAQYKYKVVVARGGAIDIVSKNEVIESGTDVGTVKYPVVAIENLNLYQPPDYIFNLANARKITPHDSGGSVKLLNGTMSLDKARVEGKVRIQQWELRRLQKRVHGFLSAEINVEIADIYLVHIPVWYVQMLHKDENIVLLVDGHTGAVMEEVKD